MREISNFPTLNVHSKCRLLHMSRGKYISTVRFPSSHSSYLHIFTARTLRKTHNLHLFRRTRDKFFNKSSTSGRKRAKSWHILIFYLLFTIDMNSSSQVVRIGVQQIYKKHFIKKLSFHFLEQRNRPASAVASNIVGQMLQNFHLYFSEARGRSFY